MIEEVTLTRNPEMTKKAFHKHFQDLIDTYNEVFVVDLLSDKKEREVILTKEYVRHIYESEFRNRVKFFHFDFHRFCAGDNYQALKILIGKLGDGLANFEFFIEDTTAKKVLKL